MAWDTTKVTDDLIIATDWNDMVTDQKSKVAKAGDESITGAKTFDKDKILMKGTSTGVTTVSTANTGASNYTATMQAKNGTLACQDDTHYIGTTSIALNRGSAAQSLTGITSIDGSSASCTGNAATATKSTNLAGGSGGTIPYQASADNTSMLANGNAGQILRSAGTTAAPVWSTPTYPNSATSGKILVGDGTNIVLSTPTYPNASATSGKIIVSDGTNYIASTPTFPNASATSGKVIKSDGTNWLASTETYAAPSTSGNVMTSDGTNWTSAAPAGAVTKITSGTLASPAATIDITSIAAGYAVLDLFIAGGTQTNNKIAYFRLNNDSTAGHYSYHIARSYSTTSSGVDTPDNTAFGTGGNTTMGNSIRTFLQFTVNNRADAYIKTVMINGGSSDGTFQVGGNWTNATDEVSRITVFMNDSENFGTGTKYILFGYK